MKPIFKFMLLLACSTMVMNVFAQSADNEDEVIKIDESNYGAYRPNEVIVHFKEDGAVQMRAPRRAKFQTTAVSAVDQLFATLGVDSVEELMPQTGTRPMPKKVRTFNGKDIEPKPLGKLYRLKLAENPNQNVFQVIEQLKQLDEVDYAEPNYLVFALGAEAASENEISLPIYADKRAYIAKSKQNATNDSAIYVQEPLYSQQWGIVAINLHKLWNKPKITTKRPVIAILDTGVDIEHPDLAANIWTNETEANGIEGQDDDANGFKDDIHGWDFINQTGVMRDFNGHGTHCAGIAAAVGDNGIGITGANPDALIMPIAVLQSDGSGDMANLIKGIDYAIDNGADILSMSLGSTVSQSVEQVLARAYTSAILLAAAGNSAEDFFMYPASSSCVFGVEASRDRYCWATFSNYDIRGPKSSWMGLSLRAPGANILSTFPNGRYKSFNGTSMACPFAAGAISRLLQTKEYLSREIMMGDFVHTQQEGWRTPFCIVPSNGNMDLAAMYAVQEEDRKPTLQLVDYTLMEGANGDGDGRVDAGEEIEIYPKFWNDWGKAKNIRYWLKVGFYNGVDYGEAENIGEWVDDDTTLVTLLTDTVNFGWELSGYAQSVAVNPARIRISPNCVDLRRINLTLFAVCDDMLRPDTIKEHIVLAVENGVELGGMITEDMILYPDVHYLVTNNLVVPQGRTLTILPGTRLKFYSGASLYSEGKLIANGTPNNKITFEPYQSNYGWGIIKIGQDTIRYANISGLNYADTRVTSSGHFENCSLSWTESYGVGIASKFDPKSSSLYKCNYKAIWLQDDVGSETFHFNVDIKYCNITFGSGYDADKITLITDSCNIVNFNPIYGGFCLWFNSQQLRELAFPHNYMGTSNKSNIKIYDVNSGYGFGLLDISNVLTTPVREAHGMVWKVLINGYDAHDEFSQLPPLGVGRHRCDVYFNRPMDVSKSPFVAYGVRSPYTQHVIDEDGSWSADSTIYTAYFTIDGKTVSDGLNRIYVSDAQDNEFFDISVENTRFDMQIAATGSLSTGLIAEAGLGKVTLTWETDEEDFEDLLGYNLYRWTDDNDTTCINSTLIDSQDTAYIDFDVVPGTDYYYIIRQVTTSLESYDLSNAVVARPLTAIKGDANGSMSVDVADVITEVNYITHQNPQPFIFEAADVNNDNAINIFDVVGTINIIRNPQTNSQAIQEGHAIYYIENGILYVESDQVLGGVQFTFAAEQPHTFTPLEVLNGFEMVSEWTDEANYLFMAYSMSGKTIGVGKNALLQIGDADLTSIALSDPQGHNIQASPQVSTALDGTPFMPCSTKYIENEHLYIKIGDRIYNVMGTLIK